MGHLHHHQAGATGEEGQGQGLGGWAQAVASDQLPGENMVACRAAVLDACCTFSQFLHSEAWCPGSSC